MSNLIFPDAPLASPENLRSGKSPDPSSVNLRFRAFLITLSPKQDITDVTVKQFVAYVKKKSIYSFVVTEVGDNGKKHLHAAVVWQMPVEKRNIFDYWSKILVKDYEGSIGRYACKVTIMYNHNWYDEYLRKGGDVVYDNYERDNVDQYFPTEEQQSRLCELKGAPEIRLHLVDQLCSEWVDSHPNASSYEDAIMFMKHRMHVLKKTPYFVDPRKLQQFCWFLYEHRNCIITPNVDERNHGARMTGNSICI